MRMAPEEDGVTDDADFQSVDDPNDVTVWHDFPGTDEARAFVSSEALGNAMQRAGVQGEPEIWFVAPGVGRIGARRRIIGSVFVGATLTGARRVPMPGLPRPLTLRRCWWHPRCSTAGESSDRT